jgi:type II secretory pathway pseudopilin PulG
MRARTAFTLTEVVVALLVTATAAVAFATVRLAEQRLRARVDADRTWARSAREHLELLATRRCGADTGGILRTGTGESVWRATTTAAGWRLADSMRATRSDRWVGISATIGCAP